MPKKINLEEASWEQSLAITIGQNVRAIRTQAGLSAADLSDKLSEKPGPKLSRSVIANIEGARRTNITVQELQAISNALEVPISSLLEDNKTQYLVEYLTSNARKLQEQKRHIKQLLISYMESAHALIHDIKAAQASGLPETLSDMEKGTFLHLTRNVLKDLEDSKDGQQILTESQEEYAEQTQSFHQFIDKEESQ